MRFGKVEYEKRDGIAILTLDEQTRLNALSTAIREGLIKGFEEVEREEEVRVAIITGAGRAFCAGANITGLKLDAPKVKETLKDIFRALTIGEVVSKPVIAAVNGLCLGGGLELAISCEIIIGSEKAQFGVPEIKIGLLPGLAMVRLHQVIGRHKAKELVLTGDPISAEEASRIGLVNKVVQHEKLLDEASEMAKRIIDKPPITVKMGKSSVNRELGGEEIVYSLDSMPFLFSTEDTKEGISAFLEKRKPIFKGDSLMKAPLLFLPTGS